MRHSAKQRAHQAVVEAMCATTQDELAKGIGAVADASTAIPEPERKTRFEREAMEITQAECAEYRRHAEAQMLKIGSKAAELAR
jgi:hypothetical protein